MTYHQKELLLLVAQGDEKAFAGLAEIILPSLQAVVMRIIHSQKQAEEILQESLIRIWMGRSKLPALENPAAWFKRVALNETFTWLNKNASRAKIFRHLPEATAVVQPAGPDNLAFRETLSLLHSAIDQLPPKRKLIYEMNRVHGLKSQEIARRLNLSTGYVKNTLGIAFEFIRKRLIEASK